MEYQAELLAPIFVCSIILIIIPRLLFNQTLKSSKLPPGPSPFPIIGNILELGKKPPHKVLTKLSKIYGPLMTLKLGNITTIVITSPQLAKQVLQENGQISSNRTVPHAVQVHNHLKSSLVWLPPNSQWRNLRRICATKVFSPNMLDSTKTLRQQKVQELLDYVKEKSNKGEVFDLGEAIFATVLNSISNTFFSMDLSNSASEKSREFRNLIWNVMVEAGRPNVADFFPILRPLDPQRIFARMSIYFQKLFEILREIIEERMHSRASKSASKVYNDVLDSLLNVVEENGSQFTIKDILHLFLELFVAGIDTTSNTLEWTMAELLHSPDKLSKARQELSLAIGKDETIEESHILKLPFLRAVVKETLRLHPPAPLLVPHKCDEIVNISGFEIPKNAQFFVNVWAMGRDPSIWENPKMFLPERFLESEIDYKGLDFELIPFGAGKRICPGLPLAHRKLHLTLASLLHKFEWNLADGLKPEEMSMKEQYGLTLKRLQPLRVQAASINQS